MRLRVAGPQAPRHRRPPGGLRLGPRSVSPVPSPADGVGPRARGRGLDRRRRRHPDGTLASARRQPSRRRRAEPQVHLRAVRHRPVEPSRPPLRRCRSRRCPPGLQPALHLRAARPRQDPPPPLRWQLRQLLRWRHDRALRHRRGVHERLPRRPRRPRPRRLQGPLPRRRRAPDRRRPIPRTQGAPARRSSFTTFNALYDAGSSGGHHLRIAFPETSATSRIACASASPPGWSTDIERPDFATRLAILRKRAAHDSVPVEQQALELLAQRVTTTVRALEGVLIRLVAYGSLTGRPLDTDLAASVLERLGVRRSAPGAHPPSPQSRQAACERSG